jgi:protein TonB
VNEIIEAPVVETKVFTIVEQMPEFPGGEGALFKFIQSNIQYPAMERDNDIQGRVIVGFVVNEDGSVSDVSVKKGVSSGLDKEAIRVVKLLPKFKPGKQQGKAVKVAYVLPIMFKLQ